MTEVNFLSCGLGNVGQVSSELASEGKTSTPRYNFIWKNCKGKCERAFRLIVGNNGKSCAIFCSCPRRIKCFFCNGEKMSTASLYTWPPFNECFQKTRISYVYIYYLFRVLFHYSYFFLFVYFPEFFVCSDCWSAFACLRSVSNG